MIAVRRVTLGFYKRGTPNAERRPGRGTPRRSAPTSSGVESRPVRSPWGVAAGGGPTAGVNPPMNQDATASGELRTTGCAPVHAKASRSARRSPLRGTLTVKTISGRSSPETRGVSTRTSSPTSSVRSCAGRAGGRRSSIPGRGRVTSKPDVPRAGTPRSPRLVARMADRRSERARAAIARDVPRGARVGRRRHELRGTCADLSLGRAAKHMDRRVDLRAPGAVERIDRFRFAAAEPSLECRGQPQRPRVSMARSMTQAA